MPWRRDPHCDHRAVTSLVDAVLRERPLRRRRFEYAVWLGVIGDAIGRTDAGRRDHDRDRQPAVAGAEAGRAARTSLATRSSSSRMRASAFELPEALLIRALGPVERFVIPHGSRRDESLSQSVLRERSTPQPKIHGRSRRVRTKRKNTIVRLRLSRRTTSARSKSAVRSVFSRNALRNAAMSSSRIDISERALARARACVARACSHTCAFVRATFPHESPAPALRPDHLLRSGLLLVRCRSRARARPHRGAARAAAATCCSSIFCRTSTTTCAKAMRCTRHFSRTTASRARVVSGRTLSSRSARAAVIASLDPFSQSRRHVATAASTVVIPARDEASRIGANARRLAGQRDVDGSPLDRRRLRRARLREQLF